MHTNKPTCIRILSACPRHWQWELIFHLICYAQTTEKTRGWAGYSIMIDVVKESHLFLRLQCVLTERFNSIVIPCLVLFTFPSFLPRPILGQLWYPLTPTAHLGSTDLSLLQNIAAETCLKCPHTCKLLRHLMYGCVFNIICIALAAKYGSR